MGTRFKVNSHCLFQGFILASLGIPEENTKISVVVAGSSEEIQTGFLWNTSLDGDTILVSNAGRKGVFSNRVIVRMSDFKS